MQEANSFAPAKSAVHIKPNDYFKAVRNLSNTHQPGTNFQYNSLLPSISPVWLYNSGRPSLSLAAAMTLQTAIL